MSWLELGLGLGLWLEELCHLEEFFIANGYPVRKVKRSFSSTARNREKDTEEDPAKPMVLPYVRGLSEK